MDRRTYKSKPQHLITDPRTGEIKRIVQSADTDLGTTAQPSNLVVHGTAENGNGVSFVDQTSFGLRLSLSASVPVPNSSIPTGSVLYLAPYTSQRTALLRNSKWENVEVTSASLALSGLTSNKNYDVFLYLNAQRIPAIELSSAWTSDTVRADAITRLDGVYVKSLDNTRRFVGTIRATGTTSTSDSTNKRFVWNYYNRVPRSFFATDSTASWTYGATSTWRQANTNPGNQVEIVVGDTSAVEATVSTIISNTQASHTRVGIGLDTTTANSAQVSVGYVDVAGAINSSFAHYRTMVTSGKHSIVWIEFTQNATATFYGTGIGPHEPGLVGTVMA